MSVKIDKRGRIVLPKRVRQRYGIHEGTRVFLAEQIDCIFIVPVKTYERPTEALYCSVKVDKPIDELKQLARERAAFEALES